MNLCDRYREYPDRALLRIRAASPPSMILLNRIICHIVRLRPRVNEYIPHERRTVNRPNRII